MREIYLSRESRAIRFWPHEWFRAQRVESALAHEVSYSDSAGLQTTRTTAIAWQSACESDKDELSQPWCCARSATAPLRRSRGNGPSRVTSISRRGNGMSGSANALITASLAANRAASL